VRLKGFQKLTSVEEAQRLFSNAVHVGKTKTVRTSLDSALSRILVEDIVAPNDLPRFDRSAVDGYAVGAKDTARASQFKPRILQITEENQVSNKQARQVWTGSPVPEGANAVVMLEDTKQTEDGIEVWTAVTPSENVSKRGEDIAKGEVALEAGTRLMPHHLSLIAALGIVEVKVFEKPRIGILTTGDELVEVGAKPTRDQILDANKHALSAMCRELGAEPSDLGIAKDDANEILGKLRLGLERTDAVLTSGGTSVGGSDLVPEIIGKLGKPGVIVHGVAMRPAMPTALAVAERKPIIVLPGNPVAAMIGFEVFARPLICRMLGLKNEEHRPIVEARMARKVATSLGRKTFVRVFVRPHNSEFLADPISARGSGLISTMTKANGYVIVPDNREGLMENECVSVHLFDSLKWIDENV
jgi:molybdopterin molybdotransferase